MPVISVFDGIVVRMYFLQSEHNPPHVHAIYAGMAAAVSIDSGQVLDGKLPQRVLVKVRSWIEIHKQALLAMWNTQTFYKLPAL